MATSTREEAIEIARELGDCPRAERFDRFFARIRDSRIPFLACQPGPDAEALYLESFEALFILGAASLPLTIALTMHQYMMSALATLPIHEPELARAIEALLSEIQERRLLIGVGSVGDNIKKKGAGSDTIAIRTGEGRTTARGRIQFSCMGSKSDRISFIGADEQGKLGLYLARTRNEGVTIGERVFADAMADADTRWIGLDDVAVEPQDVLTTDESIVRVIMYHSTVWFEALCCAAYLGAASRALDAAREFAHSVQIGEGTTLADLDGTKVEFGRMGIQLKASLGLVPQIGRALAAVQRDPVQAFDPLMEAAAIAKYTATRSAEDLVQSARRFIGTRAMMPNGIVEELSRQIVYGPLHPRVSAIFERDLGQTLLKADSITLRV
jgi:alkylation response protein AidB-like acyl-CoA dehydrogenase